MVKPNGSKFWVLRVMKDGKRVETGLGGYPKVSVAKVREDAVALRSKMKAGTDVLAEKREALAKAKAASEMTFEVVAKLAHGARKGLAEKTNALWFARLERHAFTAFGKVPVAKVDGPIIIEALEPIWHAKPETARRVRRAISSVLKYAHARDWRGPVPSMADVTKDAFPTPQAPIIHRPAVDYLKAPAVVDKLKAADETMGRLALLFTIYTAVRSGETRGAKWAEIDLANAEWTIPAGRMKMRRDHVVPLSQPAVVILEAVAKLRTVDANGEGDLAALVFPGTGNRSMSDMTLAKAHKLAAPGTVPHGWRSTFRDWAAEATDHPADVCEAALAHLIGNATTRSYQRGTMLDKRRALMNDWAAYVSPMAAVAEEPATATAGAIPFRARAQVRSCGNLKILHSCPTVIVGGGLKCDLFLFRP